MIDRELPARKMYEAGQEHRFGTTGVRHAYIPWRDLDCHSKEWYIHMAIVALENSPAPVRGEFSLEYQRGSPLHRHLYADATRESIHHEVNRLEDWLVNQKVPYARLERNGIYLASSWRNPHQEAVLKELREAKFNVYDFKHPEPGDEGFHWSEIDPEWQKWTPERFAKGLSTPLADKGFKFDMDALYGCDMCVLLLPCGRSAHLEAGWAIGAGKPTFIYCPDYEKVEPELMYKMATGFTTDLRDLISLLSGATESLKNR